MVFDTPCPQHGGVLMGGQFCVNGPPWIQNLYCLTEGCTALEGPNCKRCKGVGVWIYTQFRFEPDRKSALSGDDAPDFFRCVRCGSEVDALFPHDFNDMKSELARLRAQEIWDTIPAHMKVTAASS